MYSRINNQSINLYHFLIRYNQTIECSCRKHANVTFKIDAILAENLRRECMATGTYDADADRSASAEVLLIAFGIFSKRCVFDSEQEHFVFIHINVANVCRWS